MLLDPILGEHLHAVPPHQRTECYQALLYLQCPGDNGLSLSVFWYLSLSLSHSVSIIAIGLLSLSAMSALSRSALSLLYI